ncbi:helix-turn-helix transcriptional regulator [Corynebacterium sp. ACRQJ]|uniref:helix-turn-helix domain-containing protein n=1 Tax=Corynebacterium sp. ACRQJ TaxID=2918189 RepID=UPI001EF561DF|nr:helix-turn-helix transcriptional regulator [Corynebacterium sp. ACRQJ]MCG7267357.1 helix-turn-helix transcriptional regulator [Corynebacterium sp. ACRQJ]
MIITFKPLWKLLIDRDMTREDLRPSTGLSPTTIAKLCKDGNVITDVLARICQALDCNLEQIALATSHSDPSGENHKHA